MLTQTFSPYGPPSSFPHRFVVVPPEDELRVRLRNDPNDEAAAYGMLLRQLVGDAVLRIAVPVSPGDLDP